MFLALKSSRNDAALSGDETIEPSTNERALMARRAVAVHGLLLCYFALQLSLKFSPRSKMKSFTWTTLPPPMLMTDTPLF